MYTDLFWIVYMYIVCVCVHCMYNRTETDSIWISVSTIGWRLGNDDEHQLEEVGHNLQAECGEPEDILHTTLRAGEREREREREGG